VIQELKYGQRACSIAGDETELGASVLINNTRRKYTDLSFHSLAGRL